MPSFAFKGAPRATGLLLSLPLMLIIFCTSGARCEEPPMPTAANFVYPRDLRVFRARALRIDGAFAPDIAFALRDCANCRKTYVYGTFPRLRRQPWDNLAMVHDVVEANVLKKPPPRTMPRGGKQVARACPVCDTPENGARPDKVLFCRVIPETGDDMQIEYVVKNRTVVSKTYWLMPRDKEVVEVKLKDESEESVRKAFGAHFSLRALWNEIFSAHADSGQPHIRAASPGVWLLFRPKSMSKTDFQAFCDKYTKASPPLFTHLEPLLPEGSDPNSLSDSYVEWAGEFRDVLSSGRAEGLVGIDMIQLQKAASAVLATRNLALDVVDSPQGGAIGMMSKGQLKVDIQFAPLAAKAAQSGLSLHQACALYLTNPAFMLESAYRIGEALKFRRPACKSEVIDGRFLLLKDRKNAERKVDLQGLSDKLDPDNAFMFDLFVEVVLAWDNDNGVFGPKPLERDIAPTGLPAFIERRIRPAGHLTLRNLPNALFEPNADSDGNRYDLCYTSECSASVVYVDPTRERFAGITLEEARRIYDSLGCALPMYVEAQDTLNFPGVPNTRAFPCSAAILCGVDLASLAADNARATALSHLAGYQGTEGRVHIYAFYTNVVALTPRRLTEDELKLVKSRMKDFVAETRSEPGLELGLHFDLPRAEPRGKVLRRRR